MTRLRDKGGASPESLYELTNGYVDASRAPTVRPGTVLDTTLPAGTKGLCAFAGKLHVFAAEPIDSGNLAYVVNVLIHPDPTYVGGIYKIHFAKPFLGLLYVVAEFDDGGVYHYWLQVPEVWKPNTIYGLNTIVSPTVPRGFVYQTATKSNAPAWAPNQAKALGDVVQPTTPNGWEYVVTDVTGTPTTGDTEPAWPTAEGAQVFEGIDTTSVPSTSSDAGDAAQAAYDQLIRDRYGKGNSA